MEKKGIKVGEEGDEGWRRRGRRLEKNGMKFGEEGNESWRKRG